MRGYFGIGIHHVKNSLNIGTLFRSADAMGATYIFTIGKKYKQQRSDTGKSWRSIPLYHFEDFETFYRCLPKECRLIGVENNFRAREIKNYVHPERAVYLLGAEDHGLPNEIMTKCHHLIKIPGKHCLNVSTAGSIVVFDRINKIETPMELP